MEPARKLEPADLFGTDEYEKHFELARTPGPSARTAIKRADGIEWLKRHDLASDRVKPTPEKVYEPVPQGLPVRGAMRIVGSKNDAAVKRGPILLMADKVVPETQEWLWPGRFPICSGSVVAGNIGTGKSTFICYMIATVTAGGWWPDSRVRCKPGSVIYLQDEESRAMQNQPRLARFGADLSKVAYLLGSKRGPDVELGFCISRDVDLLDEACDQLGDARMVMVDPFGSFLGTISGYGETETRNALGPIFDFAERRRVAVVFVAHLNKDAEKPILSRIAGTFALPAKCRMAWYLSMDPYHSKRRMLSHLKGNLDDKKETALAFAYPNKKCIQWVSKEFANHDATRVDSMLRAKLLDEKLGLNRQSSNKTSKLPAARAFVLMTVQVEPLSFLALWKKAEACGFKESTLRKAVASLVDEECVAEEGEQPVVLRLLKFPAAEPETAPAEGDAKTDQK